VNERTASEQGIERQVSLPISKAIEISRQNIVHRLGRCSVTIAGIALGVAFLCYILLWSAVIDAQTREKGIEGLDKSQQYWLVSISLLTCVVGVTNSMLMSVTERYKEIGTMKCLGALDRFVFLMFLLEAGFQGLFGSLVGWIGSLLLVLFLSMTKFGIASLAVFPWGTALPILGIALVAGFVLSVGGALYPAWRARGMPPAEAMRVEV
jgi:predicted lysophospholipase L1 biosynthesis ABC-type transport system permease subunit